MRYRRLMLIRVSIRGESPLLLCRFTDADAQQMSKGVSSAISSKQKKLPRGQAEERLYLDSGGKPIVPGPNVFRSIVDAGRFTKSGKTQITTMKGSLVPAGIVMPDIECPLYSADGGGVQWEVDSRSAVIPATGGRIMVYRPRFDSWSLSFSLVVDEELFNDQLVRRLVDDAGSKIGLGAFRPARKGPFGRFKVSLWDISRPIGFVDERSDKGVLTS